jgi:hypothetical protein
MRTMPVTGYFHAYYLSAIFPRVSAPFFFDNDAELIRFLRRKISPNRLVHS